jgi:hypothetical protein
VNDGLLIEIVHGSHDPILEFLFGRDADVAEDGAGKFRDRTKCDTTWNSAILTLLRRWPKCCAFIAKCRSRCICGVMKQRGPFG